MLIVEWVQTLKPERASKILARYAIIMALLALVLQVSVRIADGGFANGLQVFYWAVIWWNARRKNFKEIFYFSMLFMALHLIVIFVILKTPSTPYLNISNPVLILDIVVSLILWSFPAAVAFYVNRRSEENVSVKSMWTSNNEILRYQKIEKSNNANEPHKAENREVNETEVEGYELKSNPEKVMNDLETRYQKGRLAIQFREDAKQGWEIIKELEMVQKLEYLKLLSDDPKREVDSIILRLVEDHRKMIEPFNDEVLNNCYGELSSLSAEAALEFKHIVDTLGDTVDPIKVKNIIFNRRGKVGKGLLKYEASLKMSLERRWAPDQNFQKLFSDEFQEFTQDNALEDIKEKDAWCLFIEELYARCNWKLPKNEKL